MSGAVLQSASDALVVSYFESYITDEEFMLLYDANQSKPIFLYIDKFDLNNWDENECLSELRI